MTHDWSDIPLRPTTRALRQFAGAWLVFFLAVGAHQYLVRKHPSAGLALMALALVIGLLGLIEARRGAVDFCGLDGGGFPHRLGDLPR